MECNNVAVAETKVCWGTHVRVERKEEKIVEVQLANFANFHFLTLITLCSPSLSLNRVCSCFTWASYSGEVSPGCRG